jgi:hypothetical protein
MLGFRRPMLSGLESVLALKIVARGEHKEAGRGIIAPRRTPIFIDRGAPALQSPPPFPKHGRPRLIDFPIEKIIIAGPRVDLAPANLAGETAGMLAWMLFPGRGVR